MKLWTVILMLLFACVLTGNPPSPPPDPNEVLDPLRFLSEVWFNEDGHLMTEFGTHPIIPSDSLELWLSRSYTYDYDYSLIPLDTLILDINVPGEDNPAIVDISSIAPMQVFNRNEDKVMFSLYRYYEFQGHLHKYLFCRSLLEWGDSLIYMSPLKQEESYVWCRANNHVFTWAKDTHPTPGTNLYQTSALSYLKVVATDQNNDPVPFVAVYHNNAPSQTAFTNEKGEVVIPVLAGTRYLSINHPLEGYSVFEDYIRNEPEDTLTISIKVEMPVQYPYNRLRGLRVFPNPYDLNVHTHISFQFFGKNPFGEQKHIRIYDIKGRFINEYSWWYWSKEKWWNPPSDLPAGKYMAKLISGNKMLGSAIFTVIK
jgi:hypothetical protein